MLNITLNFVSIREIIIHGPNSCLTSDISFRILFGVLIHLVYFSNYFPFINHLNIILLNIFYYFCLILIWVLFWDKFLNFIGSWMLIDWKTKSTKMDEWCWWYLKSYFHLIHPLPLHLIPFLLLLHVVRGWSTYHFSNMLVHRLLLTDLKIGVTSK